MNTEVLPHLYMWLYPTGTVHFSIYMQQFIEKKNTTPSPYPSNGKYPCVITKVQGQSKTITTKHFYCIFYLDTYNLTFEWFYIYCKQGCYYSSWLYNTIPIWQPKFSSPIKYFYNKCLFWLFLYNFYAAHTRWKSSHWCLSFIYKKLGTNESECLNLVDCNLGVSQKCPKSMTLCFGYIIQFLSNFGFYKHRKRKID